MADSRETFFPFPWRASARFDDDTTRETGRTPADLPDEVLVRRVARGDDAAFTELMARYERRIAHFVKWSVHAAPDLVEDIVQEVFLQVHRSAARFGGESSFRTWLYGVARNVCRQECRKLRRQPAWMCDGDEVLHTLADDRLGPLDSMTRDEALRAVRRALDELPPMYRIVLLLRDWEDLSYSEIAAALEVPIGTVRSRLHNARALLSERLAGGSSDDVR